MLRRALDLIESDERLDRIAGPLRAAARPLVEPPPVRDALSGSWFGHRLHPFLTDFAIGAFVSAAILDNAGGRDAQRSADLLTRVGVAATLPTAAAGLSDWVNLGRSELDAQRAGVVHAVANAAALGLYAASLGARNAGRRGRARFLSTLGLACLTAGGYVGGHMSYVLGAGVNHAAFQHGPAEWTRAAALEDVPEREPRTVVAGGRAILLYREGDAICALDDTCGHAGCSLGKGSVENGAIVCSCHGSAYRLRDGAVLRGPAASPQAVFETRLRDGTLEVREAHGVQERLAVATG